VYPPRYIAIVRIGYIKLTNGATLRAASTVSERESVATTPHSFDPVRDIFLGQLDAAMRIKRTFSGNARPHQRKALFGTVVPAILGCMA
jgi:hypothetical protein